MLLPKKNHHSYPQKTENKTSEALKDSINTSHIAKQSRPFALSLLESKLEQVDSSLFKNQVLIS